jgi:chromosome segregation ATPase
MIRHFKQLADQFDACKRKVSSASTQCKTALSKLDSSFKSSKNKLEEASDQLIALKHDEQKQKDTKSKLQAEIDNLAKKIANPVPEPDHAPYQDELVLVPGYKTKKKNCMLADVMYLCNFQQSLSTRIRQISNDITTFHSQQKETYEERRRLIEQQNNIQRELAAIPKRSYSPELITFYTDQSVLVGRFATLE